MARPFLAASPWRHDAISQTGYYLWDRANPGQVSMPVNRLDNRALTYSGLQSIFFFFPGIPPREHPSLGFPRLTVTGMMLQTPANEPGSSAWPNETGSVRVGNMPICPIDCRGFQGAGMFETLAPPDTPRAGEESWKTHESRVLPEYPVGA